MKIQKGDKVKVLLGKDRGKEGTVEKVLAKEGRVFVERVNLYKRHVRKTGDVEGGILEIPKSLDISNVALICPNCHKATRVGYKQSLRPDGLNMEGSAKVRICRKCGKEIGKA
ncbi:50S ribosomal protein L24 [Candidatus Daviesbacteria bacterium RIFCSPLOWO2_01_FULL_39_12]|uniref:Large ribosomal subunit protein uL24 n=1 Tax=Candidatus Daviesbacteria bacterium RIFCSPLOWO2_01_FULL_39_12 TaxID=1797785 RepID=A0A1F5KL83_9BACT|nr:MAG: 50S ribosomal protein L24 [Candidatus Daviesbacteria bacterium RIFCSPHIGHO2_02_FULL_39_8]OGE41696.1 MAG: 50S ribosomal protein L24 [Candidatus Daviesbacteria bacterium RIFCSPLOWO2_01_FULL_39_12]